MATRMQQRRGTAAQWISTNGGAGPVLNAGEMGWESDTNKFKIGDGVNNWTSLDYFSDINSTVDPAFGSSITFEGATANNFETTITVTDPTADRTITIPDVTGTVITTGNLSDITNIGVFTSTITMEGSSADDFELTLSAGNPTADRTITFPDATGTVALTTDIAAGTVTETGTQTLTNKTLTSPVISGLTLSDSGIVIEGSSADAHETTLTVTNPTADRTITFPDATGTVALTTDITASNLANDSITAVKLAGDSVTTSKIQNLAVETGKINDLAVTTGKIAEGAVTSAKIANDTIVDADINSAAAIATSKISGLDTALGLKAPLSGPALTGDATAVNLTISGNLTVNGTTTNINSTNLVVEDKNIILADVETPTDVTADGGGITLKGATDKTFNWVDATDSWTSSEHINLASGKSYSMNGTALKDVSETLTNKTLTSPVISSISNTGTLTLPTSTDTLVGRATTDTLTNKSISLTTNTVTGTIAEFNSAVTDQDLATLAGTETLTNKTLGSAVATTAFTLNATAELRLADTDSTHYVGFKSPATVSTNRIWTLPATDGTAGQALSTNGSGTLSWATAGGGGGAAFSEFMLIGA
jgi:hypothetical protein